LKANQEPQVVAPAKKRAPAVGPLDTAIRCRQELGRQYRRFVRGELDAKDLMVATHALKTLAELGILSEVEKRLTAIEARRTAPPHRPNLRRIC